MHKSLFFSLVASIALCACHHPATPERNKYSQAIIGRWKMTDMIIKGFNDAASLEHPTPGLNDSASLAQLLALPDTSFLEFTAHGIASATNGPDTEVGTFSIQQDTAIIVFPPSAQRPERDERREKIVAITESRLSLTDEHDVTMIYQKVPSAAFCSLSTEQEVVQNPRLQDIPAHMYHKLNPYALHH